MGSFKLLAVALGAALLVSACGGGGDGDQAPAVKYASVVSFGDSLSDAGTYKAGVTANVLKGAPGGGLFTVNGVNGAVGTNPTPTYTFAQLVAAAAVGTPSCAARNGGFGVVEVAVPNCTNYAQGGARVTSPFGVGNKVGGGNIAGPLTEPVVTQVSNYLADANNGGKFTGKELITVLAGANDIFGQTDALSQGVVATAGQTLATSLVTQLIAGLAPANQATAAPAITTAAGTAINNAIAVASAANGSTLTSIITAATSAATQAAAQAAGVDAATNGYANANLANAATIGATAGGAAGAAASAYASGAGATKAVMGMATAASELVASVKGMLAKGATHIVVTNLPDVSQTPMAMAADASQRQLILAMTTTFNKTLMAGLAGTPGVVMVDAFAENQNQFLNPAHYALTNTKDVACNLAVGANALATYGSNGSSLVCNTGNVIAGDTSHYLFADSVHPTPYGHKLLAQVVTKELVKAGWL